MLEQRFYFIDFENESQLIDQLWTLFEDPFEECLHTREVWQYMGTVEKTSRVRSLACHQFRHRSHPATNKREEKEIYGPLLNSKGEPVFLITDTISTVTEGVHYGLIAVFDKRLGLQITPTYSRHADFTKAIK